MHRACRCWPAPPGRCGNWTVCQGCQVIETVAELRPALERWEAGTRTSCRPIAAIRQGCRRPDMGCDSSAPPISTCCGSLLRRWQIGAGPDSSATCIPPGFIGGYELAARDVARMLVARGHAVTVLSSPALDGAADPTEPCTILRSLDFAGVTPDTGRAEDHLIRGLYLNLRNLDALRGVIDAERPDVVLCFNLVGLGVLGILRLLSAAGVPSVMFLMDNWFAGVARQREKFSAFRRMFAMSGDVFGGARVVGCSRRVLAEVADEIDADLTDAVRIPAWVELDQIAPDDLVCGEDTRFLYASRIAPHKGIEIVVQAASLLRKRRQTGFLVDVFGAGLAAMAVPARACPLCRRPGPLPGRPHQGGDDAPVSRLRRPAVRNLGAGAVRLFRNERGRSGGVRADHDRDHGRRRVFPGRA